MPTAVIMHLVIREHIVCNRSCFRAEIAPDRAPVVVDSETTSNSGGGERETCDAAEQPRSSCVPMRPQS
jgi:hypothetical protein